MCTRHKRHRMSGDFHLNNLEYEKIEKFNQLINPTLPQTETTEHSSLPETESAHTSTSVHHVTFAAEVLNNHKNDVF